MLRIPIYLDNHATTPVDPRVFDAMLPWLRDRVGNAASTNHSFGTDAARAVETARTQIAVLLNTVPKSLVFTSGATEANNLALRGVLGASPPGSHLIVSAAEHRAILDPARKLERSGHQLTVLPVDRDAALDPQQVADAIRPNTVLVSTILANNEVGTLNPLQEIGEICRSRGVLLHTDAAQAVGKIPIDLETLPIDLLSFSAHKLYAAQGIGALSVRRSGSRIRIEPQLLGGGHEGGLRSGTLPVALIVGFGRACELARSALVQEPAQLLALRERLRLELNRELEGVTLNGHPLRRLPGNLNVSFGGVDGDALMTSLTEIAVSSGSACTTADPEPSHVLRAMGVSDVDSRASLRFGIGRFNTAEEIDFAVDYVAAAVRRLRSKK